MFSRKGIYLGMVNVYKLSSLSSCTEKNIYGILESYKCFQLF